MIWRRVADGNGAGLTLRMFGIKAAKRTQGYQLCSTQSGWEGVLRPIWVAKEEIEKMGRPRIIEVTIRGLPELGVLPPQPADEKAGAA